MNLKKLATHYLRYWHRESDSWVLADNAPAEFWAFAIRLPASLDRGFLYEGLRSIANGEPPAVPNNLFFWFATHPAAEKRCDEVLNSRQPPKNISTVMRAAYLAEAASGRAEVQSFLQARLEQY